LLLLALVSTAYIVDGVSCARALNTTGDADADADDEEAERANRLRTQQCHRHDSILV
jgi:hypothetical protein